MEIGSTHSPPAPGAFWKGRRVLVTGATGLIGSWLVKKLILDGAEVIALVRDADWQSELYRNRDIERIRIVQGCVEDFETLERAVNEFGVQTAFHLAAQTIVGVAHRSPRATFESNVRGTYNVLEVCRLYREMVEQVVVASSDKAYGEQAVLPYTEEMSLKGLHPYEVSKSCADLLAQSYAHTYALPVAIVRCGNVYGGGDLNWSRLVPATIRSCLRNERPLIRSDGKFIREYIYVKDVARAYMLLAEQFSENERVPGRAFNFSTETPLTVLELVQQIQHLMGCEHLEPDVQNRAHGEIRAQDVSAARAREILSWEPEYNLERGLTESIEWYRALLSA
jgi:CDP-glucose 4,6-dehydratase